MALTLDQLKVGSTAQIKGFHSTSAPFRQKLLALGITPGAQLQVVRLAPLGDPMEIKVRGFALSLRKQEAQIIKVKTLIANSRVITASATH